ncbi:1-aminocyclopropane-1-carboxylate deaminase/D-cysteine desulfhydrase [Chitinophaga pinensis]|uniref:1-aminocyclopropane-1-carboxylate deaminase n=1 Tax=Chitinophaga pinensis (strain ATCC 43595 / DSM 2588 / LMG 13176 / NBRC 15968 / NCIMB 11800 / UQM 2034) TaxID=485918 RepID=A0A979G217_CHIPD|nr:pyridoxal-phosphate dependent enzyme [Chitinophaga pinensis]ACU59410.1 1-aminocyclopropane-1-carboxylate deaminase [Chitinophaga pinensis DSM 2588]
MQFDYDNIQLQFITPSWLPSAIRAAVLRLDLLHPEVSGNKWFKLRYNLEAAIREGKNRIVTFGGAYSNHIAATAAACQLAGISCTGIIRGESAPVLSHTLQEAAARGMELVFISREAYRLKAKTDWAALYPDAWIVPEGGSNALGAKGCEEILPLAVKQLTTVDKGVISPATAAAYFSHIACAVGTGTTLAGIINSAAPQQTVFGYAVLKGAAYLQEEIQALLHPAPVPHWELLHEHHGGGYAKVTPALKTFMADFHTETGIELDMVYTAKLLMGFRQDVLDGRYADGSKVLLIHTGGLQGNAI